MIADDAGKRPPGIPRRPQFQLYHVGGRLSPGLLFWEQKCRKNYWGFTEREGKQGSGQGTEYRGREYAWKHA